MKFNWNLKLKISQRHWINLPILVQNSVKSFNTRISKLKMRELSKEREYFKSRNLQENLMQHLIRFLRCLRIPNQKNNSNHRLVHIRNNNNRMQTSIIIDLFMIKHLIIIKSARIRFLDWIKYNSTRKQENYFYFNYFLGYQASSNRRGEKS